MNNATMTQAFKQAGLPIVKLPCTPTGRTNRKGKPMMTMSREDFDKLLTMRLNEAMQVREVEYARHVEAILHNAYSAITLVAFIVLRDKFGFGKIRANRFAKAYGEKLEELTQFDQYGIRYLTYEDLQKTVKDELGIIVDENAIKTIEKTADTTLHQEIPKMNILSIYEWLKASNYDDAAQGFYQWFGDEIEKWRTKND